jgi:hypothetical protein
LNVAAALGVDARDRLTVYAAELDVDDVRRVVTYLALRTGILGAVCLVHGHAEPRFSDREHLLDRNV